MQKDIKKEKKIGWTGGKAASGSQAGKESIAIILLFTPAVLFMFMTDQLVNSVGSFAASNLPLFLGIYGLCLILGCIVNQLILKIIYLKR